ncbi:dipeptidyl peptidase 2-like [Mytilus trossulus]|uniref:dipeptidyl peptidase 2-like n=1 Tax=Mytilus trossulus TaxID=6551 RepID=UPI003006E663
MAAPMQLVVGLAIVFSCVQTIVQGNGYKVQPYKESYFDQFVDHFNFLSFGQQRFKQRVLTQDKWWKRGSGPIFFYTGNEGPIDEFWDNTGFVFDIAPEFGALVVFAEHRFYGKSMPFPSDNFNSKNVGLLTIEQALADYAVLLTSLKKSLNATGCPVIAFGGSYGGMLSAYMRYKYPGIIAGSIASSAPIYLLDPNFPKTFFWKTVTKDFNDASSKCVGKVRDAFSIMNATAAKGDFSTISSKFHLCNKLTDLVQYRHLLLWIRNAFGSLSMMDYPYPTDFLANLPAYPVKEACNYLMAEEDSVVGLSKAAGLFYNGTNGSLKCFDIFSEYIECADPTGCGTGDAGAAWDYQACTEVRLPQGTDGTTDMFPVLPFTDEIRQKYCYKRWGVVPRDAWGDVQLINLDLKGASNIVFANGNLDPWMGGGVLSTSNPGIKVILIEGGAHHLDLRSANPMDPASVKQARVVQKQQIQQWINQGGQHI